MVPKIEGLSPADLVLRRTGSQCLKLFWLAAAVLVLAMQAAPASAQTLGGSCATGYSADQISVVENNIVVCNTSQVWQNLLGAPAADPNGSIAIGANSLANVTTGAYNNAIGYESMMGTSATPLTGNYNVAFGDLALRAIQGTTQFNTAVGYEALESNTTGGKNIATGAAASSANTTGSANVAVGYAALNLNSTGSGDTALGGYALLSNTTSPNDALGYDAGYYITTGSHNIALGYEAMRGISATPVTGSYNTVVGNSALYQAQGAANDNTTLGYESGYGVTTGTDNTLVGYEAGYGVIGNYNIIIGEDPNSAITSGSSNILIGNSLMKATNTSSNQLDIADTIFANLSSGNVGIGTSTYSGGGLTVNGQTYSNAFLPTSDARLKKNVQPLENSLQKIAALRGVTYDWREPAERSFGKDMSLDTGRHQMGVIAQEVEQVYPDIVLTSPNGLKTVNSDALIGPLIEAVKTLKRQNEALMAAVALLYLGLTVLFSMYLRQRVS
jgi:hypothetical protein